MTRKCRELKDSGTGFCAKKTGCVSTHRTTPLRDWPVTIHNRFENHIASSLSTTCKRPGNLASADCKNSFLRVPCGKNVGETPGNVIIYSNNVRFKIVTFIRSYVRNMKKDHVNFK